jgi:hypothetical protein
MGRGWACLPKPHEKVGDVFHGVLFAATSGSRHPLSER